MTTQSEYGLEVQRKTGATGGMKICRKQSSDKYVLYEY